MGSSATSLMPDPLQSRVAKWVWDIETNEMQGTDAIARVAGIPAPDRSDRRNLSSWMADDSDREQMESATRRLLVGDTPPAVRFRVYDVEGAERHMVCGATLHRECGRSAIVRGFVRDVTEEVHRLHACPALETTATRIGIVASDHFARVGIRAVLGPHRAFNVVSEMAAGDLAACAVNKTSSSRLDIPDVLLLDIDQGGEDILEILGKCQDAQQRLPKIIAVVQSGAAGILRELAAFGVDGLLPGNVSSDELVRCLRSVIDGQRVIGLGVLDAVPDRAVPSVASPLTDGELEILRKLALGMRNREIAAAMFVSVPTVKRHVQRIYEKLDARDRAHAATIATRLGLV